MFSRLAALGLAVFAVFATLLAACSPSPPPNQGGTVADSHRGPGGAMGGGTAMMGRGMMGGGGMMAAGDTAAAPRAAPAPATAPALAAAGCPAVDAALVMRGRAVFSGPGNCQSCHAANAKGTPLGPDLTDQQWLIGDGSLASIAQLVRTGVPRPKQHPAAMPPMGGATLTSRQVCAVAAYVYSLSH